MPESSTPAAAHQPDAAETRLREQLHAQPNDVEALRSLGQICARSERFAEARQLLKRVIELQPGDDEARLIAAGLAGAEGDLDAAEHSYNEIVARRPDAVGAWVGLAKVALHRDLPRQAQEHYRRALKHDPDHMDALLGLGRERLASGDVEQALPLFQHATEVAPRHPLALLSLAQTLIARGESQQAARPLTRALEIDPEFAHARFLLAQIDVRRNRAVAAEAGFRTVIAGGTHAGRAHAGLGNALHSQGRTEQALAAYEHALLTQSDDESVITGVADCKLKLGRSREAMSDLETFIATHPRCVIPRVLLADMLGARGDKAQALAMWRDAAERDPDDLLAQTETALHLEAAGEFVAAAEVAGRTGADPRPQAVLLRSRCAVRSGEYAHAEQELLSLTTKALPAELVRERFRLLGLAHDHHARYDEAVLAFREAQRIGAGKLPPLAPASDVRRVIDGLIDDPVLPSSLQPAPVLLLGTPGSGVERIAALLADQPGVVVREDRFAGQNDLLADGGDPRMPRSLSEGELKVMQRRYHRALARHVQGQARCMIDWVPTFDARVLAQLRRALPGVRVLIVPGDPEQAFLDWLAFGWQRDYRVADPVAAAHWWRLANEQIELAAEILPSERIDATAVLADPHNAGPALAAFLGLDEIKPGPRFHQRSRAPRGLPVQFAPGHAQNYRSALAEAFAKLKE